MMSRKIAILHAPSPLGLKPPAEGRVPGVRLMPEALRRAGLHTALLAAFAGEVAPPPYVPDRDPALKVRNPHAIAAYSVDLANAIQALLATPSFPLILGGDCSILIGTVLALRRKGRFGLLYLDAHSDCQTPESSETGGIAGMPLAIATGHGLDLLAGLEGRQPFIAESDVVVIGCRDLFDVAGTSEKWVAGTKIRVRDLEEVRRFGPERVASDALEQLTEASVDGIWIHLDVDVLDPAVMPAVDSPDPGGLTAQELIRLLTSLMRSPLVQGMEVTIYDPERDPEGRAAEVIVNVLRETFRPATSLPPDPHQIGELHRERSKKTSVLFIHGGGQGAYEEDRKMAASLQKALGAAYDVRCPSMPGEDQPVYAEWKDQIAQELATMDGEVVLVGHSLGASMLLKYLSEEQVEKPVSGLFLIAPPYWGAEDWQVSEYTLHDDFASKLPRELPVFFYHSRDDEWVPFAHLALYQERLPQATVHAFDDRGHQFNDDLSEVAQDILDRVVEPS